MRIDLMGTFRVVVDGREITGDAWPGRRAIELVQLLALSSGRRLRREQAIDALWPHLEPAAGAANLRKAAHHARFRLGGIDAVVLDRVSVALFPARPIDIDAEDFERRAVAAIAAGDSDEAAAVAAAYAGDLLPDAIYEEWTQVPRRRLRQRQVELLRHAHQWARLIEFDRTDEAAYAALMREALAQGSRHAAIRWYGRLRDALACELGVAPTAETEALYRACVADLAVAEPMFVGRQSELAIGTAALRAVADGDVGVIVLRGAAGIGKSAFARQLAEVARDDGWSVATVAVGEAGVAYAPIGQVVRQLLGRRADVFDRLPAHARAVLTTVAGGARRDRNETAPITRHHVAGAFRRLCDELGGAGVLVVLDEAQRADEATRHVLLRLVGSGTARLVTVLAYRPELVDAGLVHDVSRTRRSARAVEIDLGPLPRSEAEALALSTTRVRRGDDGLAQIMDMADGNPFLILELTRCVETDGVLSVPPSAWAGIVTRLLDLRPDATATLQRLAVAGDDFDATGVVAVTGLGDDDAYRFLDAAIAAGALVVSGASYRFRHELVRQALVAPLAPHRRLRIHRDTARRLAAAGAEPALIAHHWLAGHRPGDAVGWLLAAARDAVAVGAFSDAPGPLERLLTQAPTHGDALNLYADVLDALGDARAAEAYAAAAGVLGEPRSHEIRPKQALALLKADDPRGALAALHGAEPQTMAGRLCQALTLSGAAVIGAGDPDTAAAKAEEARRYALRSRDPGALVEASWAASLAAHSRSQLTDRLVADLLATRDAPELAVRVFDGHLCATERLLYGARPYRELMAFATSLASEAKRLGAARGHAFALTLRGEANLLAGRLADADGDLADGARLHHEIGAAAGESLSLQRRAQVALYQDRTDTAASLLTDSLAAARDSYLGNHLLDRIYGTRIARSDAGHAAALIDEAETSVCGPAETCPACRITLTVPAAIGAAHVGDLNRATAYAETSKMIATVMLRQPGWNAWLAEVQAHCALAGGDRAAARDGFGKAADAFRAAGQPLDDDRCRRLLSTC